MFGKSSRRRKGDARIMIKIIKPGTITELRCYKCGCLFSYEKEDIEIKKVNTSDPLSMQYKYITCPQCKKEITLEATR